MKSLTPDPSIVYQSLPNIVKPYLFPKIVSWSTGNKLPGYPQGQSPIKPDSWQPAGLKYLKDIIFQSG
jgi:hypothetical protein